MVKIKTLSNTSNQEILNCFNLSFSDYSIPFKLNLDLLETKITAENINPEISIGAFRKQKLIGFVLHGDRKVGGVRKAYNAGTGVIPDERGRALTRRMYDFIRPELERMAFGEIILEVISNNTPAIKSYEKIGFKPVRGLSCYNGEPIVNKINREVVIRQFENANFEELNQIGEMEPTWQNTKETIINLGRDALCFLAYMGTELCGYTVLNSNNNRILQIAVKKEMRNRLVGSSLLHHLTGVTSKSISIINVDSNFNSVTDFLENRNLRKSLTQEEMKLKIANR
ncbi:GNAT family N-acetyltransferase [Muricauda sp. JGD-17]|uniref:GNAT family N-acetyltransferase n=1 Tax=Flagellimonas ochracea TaxID=2696472 RepID=A0A964TEB6_9FLAO|nr:GNAT family N-acetyltransferase [Allomuricauda ochracea]NAY93375.1 GNAT family N-acetyltransferase [Allomuricauda ochracea]